MVLSLSWKSCGATRLLKPPGDLGAAKSFPHQAMAMRA
jgi:hypothetical protein